MLCALWMLGGPADRTDDVLVAGAPGDLAGDGLPDLRLVRVRVAVEQPAGGHHHARRAEPALEAVALDKPLLHRVELAVPLQALNRTDGTAVRHGGEYRARLDRPGVQPHHAAAAVRRVAAPVAAGQAEFVAQEVDEQQSGLDVARVLGAVHGHCDPHGHAAFLRLAPSAAGPAARAAARRSARVVSSATRCRL